MCICTYMYDYTLSLRCKSPDGCVECKVVLLFKSTHLDENVYTSIWMTLKCLYVSGVVINLIGQISYV